MNITQFDRLAKALAAANTRRTLSRGLAALTVLPLVGASSRLAGEAGAKRRRSRAGAEKKKPKKKTLCLNGETIQAKKKKVKKLRKRGATSGACPTGCTPACPQGQRCCGTNCVASPWANQTVFGSAGVNDSNFATPVSLALTADGLIALIADNGNNRISVWTRPDASSTAWANQHKFGSQGAGSNRFDSPNGVAVTPDGLTALIADTGNHRISVWTRPDASSPAWTPQPSFGTLGTEASNLKHPSGVSITPDGLTAAVADSGNNRISVWTRPNTNSAWSSQTRFGFGQGDESFNIPQDVSITPDGLTVAVADTENDRISVWARTSPTASFGHQKIFGGEGQGASAFNSPHGVRITQDGLTALIADSGNNRISIWTRPDTSSTAWTNQTTFGQSGTEVTRFLRPFGVTLAPDGVTVVIADTFNKRVSLWALTCPA